MSFQTFGSYLDYLIDARMTLGEFRTAVSISESFLFNILSNRAPMPLRRIDAFADLLVEGKEARERFCLAAELTHAPLRLRKAFLTYCPEVMAVPTVMANPAPRRTRSKRRPAQSPKQATPKASPRPRLKPGASS